MPHHKSAKKRLRTAEKANELNKAIRSRIRTRLKKVRTAPTKEEASKEVPALFSLLDKAALKHRAGFNKNRVGNYKRKVHNLLNSLA